MFNQFCNYVQNFFSTVLHHLLKLHVSVILFDFSTAPYRWVKFKSRMGTSTCMRKAGWWHALHMFAESFQGQYKDGTNDPCDFRMVSASFLILGILTMVSYLPHHKIDNWPSLEMQSALFVIATGFYAIAKPYK